MALCSNDASCFAENSEQVRGCMWVLLAYTPSSTLLAVTKNKLKLLIRAARFNYQKS